VVTLELFCFGFALCLWWAAGCFWEELCCVVLLPGLGPPDLVVLVVVVEDDDEVELELEGEVEVEVELDEEALELEDLLALALEELEDELGVGVQDSVSLTTGLSSVGRDTADRGVPAGTEKLLTSPLTSLTVTVQPAADAVGRAATPSMTSMRAALNNAAKTLRRLINSVALLLQPPLCTPAALHLSRIETCDVWAEPTA
jgi:hypothetical protein